MLSIGERNISPQLWILYILLAVVVSMLMSCKRLNLHALRNLVASWRCHLPRRALLPFGWVETCGFGVPNFASQPPKATYRRITMKHPHCFVDFPVKYRDAQASHGPPHHLDVDCCKLKHVEEPTFQRPGASRKSQWAPPWWFASADPLCPYSAAGSGQTSLPPCCRNRWRWSWAGKY